MISLVGYDQEVTNDLLDLVLYWHVTRRHRHIVTKYFYMLLIPARVNLQPKSILSRRRGHIPLIGGKWVNILPIQYHFPSVMCQPVSIRFGWGYMTLIPVNDWLYRTMRGRCIQTIRYR